MPTIAEPIQKQETNLQKKFYPNYRVLLHNDDSVFAGLVVNALQKHIPGMNETKAIAVMMEAHQSGTGIVIVCAQERAEAYEDVLKSEGLTISIEPVEVGG
jgi:ATP-dependent Clp protease adaptor protein ClpS